MGLLMSKCTVNETDASGAKVSRTCTSDEAADRRNSGWISIGIGTAAAGWFAGNALRARDSVEEDVPTEPRITETDWASCGTEPLAGLPALLMVGGGSQRIEGQLDAEGRASFDVSKLDWSHDMMPQEAAALLIGDEQRVSLDVFRQLPQYAQWRKEEDARQLAIAQRNEDEEKARAKERVRAEKEQSAREAKRKAELSQWPVVSYKDLAVMVADIEMVKMQKGDSTILGFFAMESVVNSMQCALSVSGRIPSQVLRSSMETCMKAILEMVGAENIELENKRELTFRISPTRNSQRMQVRQYVVQNTPKWEQQRFVNCVDDCLRQSSWATVDHCRAKCSR
jgi:hypothetical protein